MKHLFTSEKLRPSDKTIYFIKQIAYTYNAIKKSGNKQAYCLS